MPSSKRRSWLLVPPHEEAVDEALGHGPDVLVIDMVELVLPEANAESVKRLPAVVEMAAAAGGPEVFLQVNVNRMTEELEAGVLPGVSGVVIPRLEWKAQVRQANAVLSRLEEGRGIAAGSLQMVASLDTALGNHRAMELIQSSPRMWGVSLGTGGPGDGLGAGTRWGVSSTAVP